MSDRINQPATRADAERNELANQKSASRTTGLKPCPFCGAEMMPRHYSADDGKTVAAAWNRRVATTTVTVPRWALDYLLQHADCDDAGGHQSSEMIAARYHLELAMEEQ